MSDSEHHLIYKPETEGLGEMSVDRILTVPNVITTVRLLFIPVFVYLLFVRESPGWAAVVLATLGATDWVDGYVARRFNQSSNFGAMYDPTVDRLLLVVAIVSILIDGAAPRWFAIVILVREIVVSVYVVTITAMGAKRMDVSWWGKVGTFLNMFAFPTFLLAQEPTFSETTRDIFLVLAYMAAVPGLIFSLMAAVQYFWRGRDALREGRAERAASLHPTPEPSTTNKEST